jgi:glutamate carboxypeptidase
MKTRTSGQNSNSSIMNDLVQVVAANQGRLRSRLRQLVEVESPSEDKAGVQDAIKIVQEWFKTLKHELARHKNPHFGDVLEARFGPSRSSRGRVMLLGHLDTVWPLGTLKSMPWREAGGKLYGPGVLDMKAGVVMAIEALEALQTLGLARPTTLLLNSDEEVGSPFSRAITERIASTCAAVFVLEPAQVLAYKTARKGVGHFNLRVEGVAAHAGVDFQNGHSAVLEMSRLINKVSAFTDLQRGITVNAGVIHGGTRSNVVAAECSAEVDVRIAKASDAARVERMFNELKTFDSGCKLTVSGGINRPPMERRPPIVALFRQAQRLAKEIGVDLDEAATGGGSDGNFTAALGVPTLDGMGAVGAGAHAAHEHVVTKHLIERTTLLAGMLATV